MLRVNVTGRNRGTLRKMRQTNSRLNGAGGWKATWDGKGSVATKIDL